MSSFPSRIAGRPVGGAPAGMRPDRRRLRVFTRPRRRGSINGDSKGRRHRQAGGEDRERAARAEITEAEVRVARGQCGGQRQRAGQPAVGRRGRWRPRPRPGQLSTALGRLRTGLAWAAGTGKTFIAGPRRRYAAARRGGEAHRRRPRWRRANASASCPRLSEKSTPQAPVWRPDRHPGADSSSGGGKGEIEVAPIALLRGSTLSTPSHRRRGRTTAD